MISIDFYHWYNNGGPRQGHDNFSVWLFCLIAKADMLNRALLSSIYPLHVDLWERFMNDENFAPPPTVSIDYIEEKMKEWGINGS